MRICLKLFVLFILLSAGFTSAFAQGNFPVGGKAWVSGQITFEGKPIDGVKITAMGEKGIAMAVNASNGNYALGLAEGEWAISASKEGYAAEKPIKINIKGDESKENINISLKKFNSLIKGKVVDESGTPLAGAYVLAAPVPSMGMDEEDEDSKDGDAEDVDPASITPSFIQSGKDGSFTLLVDKGNYLVMANKNGYEMSPNNPPAKIPGMENSPVRLPGIMIRLKANEVKDGVVIILKPVQVSSKPGMDGDIPDKPMEVATVKNILVGKACASPNNVLHWVREADRDKNAFYVITRSAASSDGKIQGETTKFDFMINPYGYPAKSVYSFTDNTAKAGKIYFYTVQEMGTKGVGPASNSVKLETR
jgi:hypothetical protein